MQLILYVPSLRSESLRAWESFQNTSEWRRLHFRVPHDPGFDEVYNFIESRQPLCDNASDSSEWPEVNERELNYDVTSVTMT